MKNKKEVKKDIKTKEEKTPVIHWLNRLKPAYGSKHRKKIVGRGEGSGHGGSSTRGRKGQTARSGDRSMGTFEGGQIPLVRKIPKRGFTNRSRVVNEVVNIELLEAHFESGAEVTPEKLIEMGLIHSTRPLKVLGGGEIKKSLVIKAHSFSKSAEEKIKSVGGKPEKIVKSSTRGYGEKVKKA
jgi:large subunit ribosomal protein L15